MQGTKIVYTGNIGLRLDYQFLLNAARRFHQHQWIFVGPIDEREFRGYSLRALPNVHFLGGRPYEMLPAYVQHADIGLIPFECNELTKCIYPLKVNEYLAAGKPVLATPFADLSAFGETVHFYQGLGGFGKKLEALEEIARDSELIAQRKAMAAKNDWSARALQIEALLEEALSEKTSF